MATIRNVPTTSPEALASLIDVRPGRVVSMALSSSDACQLMVMTFDESESVSEECYFGDTLYYVIEGALEISQPSGTCRLGAGDVFAVSANIPHAVAAQGSCKLLQLTIAE
ncbi:cupin domain-containing protein [Eggerthellaceae bacterium zg-887]|uniref:cupin domain-containing protein n=1 Tax=Xiamenia xianingshaonis TaxID=2682776 RepID=UPI00140DC4AD|nr:cupin domain-containing protein [Xiamenia xianingshaonis]NHM15646.1 cupin domain-containing protein [Xiamenia xianingshaonis]